MSTEIAGRYQVVAEIGRGGMATVYRAHDPGADRDVAVKVLHQEYLNDLGFRARFEREAETISRLQHPAIVPMIEFGQHESGLFIAMEYMPRGSLADLMDAGPLTAETTAKIVERVSAALDYAHVRGVIHRDLKPSNILFDQEDRAFLADFGIALEAASASSAGEIISGTPAYMSPEQAQREGQIDGRSDLYALGVSLFQMLTGRLPFEAETPVALLHKQAEEAPPSPLTINPDLAPEVEPLLFTALAKDPAERFQTGAALSESLNRALGLDPPDLSTWVGPVTDAALGTEATVADQSDQPAPVPAAGQDGKTLRAAAGRWLEKRPLAIPLLASLLGVLCAAILVTAIRAPAFMSAVDRDRSAERAPPTGTSQSPGGGPGATSIGRPNTVMLYADDAMTIVNNSTEALSLEQVLFRRVPEKRSSPEFAFPARAWNTMPGRPVDTLLAGECLQLLPASDSAAGGPITPPDCGDPPVSLVSRDEAWIFWLPAVEGAAFEVLRDGRVIQVCFADAGRCEFDLPRSS